MAETVEAKLNALAEKQGHPGSINVAEVGHMMKSWKGTHDTLKGEVARLTLRLREMTDDRDAGRTLRLATLDKLKQAEAENAELKAKN